MQIQLKQTEIVTALKQYIAQQGIDLRNKEVTITFTAGRKEGGLSADLVIEDCSIPGFTEATETEDDKPTGLTVVKGDSVDNVKTAQESPKAAVEEPEAQSELMAESSSETGIPVAKPNSLFN